MRRALSRAPLGLCRERAETGITKIQWLRCCWRAFTDEYLRADRGWYKSQERARASCSCVPVDSCHRPETRRMSLFMREFYLSSPSGEYSRLRCSYIGTVLRALDVGVCRTPSLYRLDLCEQPQTANWPSFLRGSWEFCNATGASSQSFSCALITTNYLESRNSVM